MNPSTARGDLQPSEAFRGGNVRSQERESPPQASLRRAFSCPAPIAIVLRETKKKGRPEERP